MTRNIMDVVTVEVSDYKGLTVHVLKSTTFLYQYRKQCYIYSLDSSAEGSTGGVHT